MRDCGALVTSQGEEVVLVVDAKGLPQAAEDAGAVVLPLEGGVLLAPREVLRHLSPSPHTSHHATS